MSDFDFKWKLNGFKQIRRAPKVVDALERMGKHITDEANSTLNENTVRSRISQRRVRKVGYRMSSQQGAAKPFGRWQVRVYTSSRHAKYSNAKHDTLRRLLNGEQS